MQIKAARATRRCKKYAQSEIRKITFSLSEGLLFKRKHIFSTVGRSLAFLQTQHTSLRMIETTWSSAQSKSSDAFRSGSKLDVCGLASPINPRYGEETRE
jgi:hypothetical protein